MPYEGILSILFGTDTVADTLEVELSGVGIPNVGVLDSAVNPPRLTALLEASPNPFNSTLTIRFQSVQSVKSVVNIYDLSGREVFSAVTAPSVTGNSSKAVTHGGMTAERVTVWDASASPAGVYFVRLQSGTEILTKKVVLLR
jgi:hypothetical protein